MLTPATKVIDSGKCTYSARRNHSSKNERMHTLRFKRTNPSTIIDLPKTSVKLQRTINPSFIVWNTSKQDLNASYVFLIVVHYKTNAMNTSGKLGTHSSSMHIENYSIPLGRISLSNFASTFKGKLFGSYSARIVGEIFHLFPLWKHSLPSIRVNDSNGHSSLVRTSVLCKKT